MSELEFDMEAARRNYRKRIRERQDARLRLWEQAKEQADRAVELIVERYHPSRVIQWGSILRPDYFTEVSDIDIAVEGMSDPEAWSKMERELIEQVTFPLDLVSFDGLHPEHRKQILARGKVVYDRSE